MKYRFERRDNEQIVVCRMDAFMTTAEAEVFASEWRNRVIAARKDFGTLRILFDNSAGGVMSAATGEIMGKATRDLIRPGDRVAVIVSTQLAKMQAKRSSSAGAETFGSEGEAVAWLLQDK